LAAAKQTVVTGSYGSNPEMWANPSVGGPKAELQLAEMAVGKRLATYPFGETAPSRRSGGRQGRKLQASQVASAPPRSSRSDAP
jgi:hypothetical protein